MTIFIIILLSGLTIFSVRISSKLKQTNEELKEAIQQKEKLFKLGQSMAMIAHDLRSPISAIHSGVEVLKTTGKLREVESSILREIEKSTTHGIELITDILDYTKTMGAKIEILMCQKFADLVENDVEPMKIKYPKVEFLLDVPNDCQIYLDPLKMRRAIQNIINNAFEALAESDVESPKIRVDFYKDDHFHNIVIADNGPGMPEEIQEKVFQAFHTSGKHHGTGLGLAIAREFVQSHKGSITCESKPGETIFHVKLPQKPSSASRSA